MQKLSKLSKAVKLAYEKGYRVQEDGSVISSVGNKLNPYLLNRGKGVYYAIAVALPKSRTKNNFLVHRLAAYQKFGEIIFLDGVQVRHLDGNSKNNCLDNISIGTASQNIMDIDPGVRRKNAIKASRSKKSARSEKFWKEVEKDRRDGLSYNNLCKKYKITKGSLSYHFKKYGR